MSDRIMPEEPSAPLLYASAWIGRLEARKRTSRMLHDGDRNGTIMKGWTGMLETFRVKTYVPDKSIPCADLNKFLSFRYSAGKASSGVPAEGWDLALACVGEEEVRSRVSVLPTPSGISAETRMNWGLKRS